MTIPERNVTIKGAFAEDANTNIPETPVPGISYRDANTTEAEMKDGFPFKTIVDSSKFNEMLFEYSTISKMQEKFGFVPWSALTDYETGSLCLGTDGNVYQALQASGPSTTAYNPVNDTAGTYWVVWLANYQLGIGDIKASARSSNHGNWFLCDGQAISRTTYATLFSIIGTNFGSGDGSTTFNLPDYRGKFLRGLGGDSAQDIYTTQDEGLPNITGNFISDCYRNNEADITGAFKLVEEKSYHNVSQGSNNANIVVGFDASDSSQIYGNSNHVTPINQAVNYFIRVR